ncbi:MAG: DMT family transporter [Bacteroides sp.]|nr:DMT family transporter [Bacteroides sp.]MCM1413851.1 DMT family transporter [Bacteroides sp.]MCM1471040.1 DMT family transporter [Bacteroides sp.]
MEPEEVTSRSRMSGHVALLLANLFWGIMSPISKALLLGGHLTPLALSAIRIGGGALLFFLCSLALPSTIAPREKIRRSDLGKIFLASILMISANQGLFILGIGYTNPIDSAVMSSMTPMLTMLLAAVVLHYPITRLKFAGVMLGLVGVVILVGSGSRNASAENALLGDSLCFCAQICAALYYVLFSGLIKRYSPFTLMKWMFWMSAVTYVPFCLPQLLAVDYAAMTSGEWWSIAYIIVFATCISYLTLPYAQRRLKPTVVSIYNYFQPLFSAIVAVWLGVGEFGPVKAAATLLIFAGVYFVNNNTTGPRATKIQPGKPD